MTARAAFVLGLFLLLAAIVHGGIYSAGHDFVMNRFTGWYEFVPGDDGGYDDEAGERRAALCTLTSTTPAARFAGLHRRR
jgi:hypothetical protein